MCLAEAERERNQRANERLEFETLRRELYLRKPILILEHYGTYYVRSCIKLSAKLLHCCMGILLTFKFGEM